VKPLQPKQLFTAGCHFSEWSLACPSSVAIDTATSQSTCELYSLSVAALSDALQHMPLHERAPLIAALLSSNCGSQFHNGCSVTVDDQHPGLWTVTLEADGTELHAQQQQHFSSAAVRHGFVGSGSALTARRGSTGAAAVGASTTAAVGNVDDDDVWEMSNNSDAPWAALQRNNISSSSHNFEPSDSVGSTRAFL
jgi:hypothetical protein